MSLTLGDGSRVGVIGGGPAGSLFAYFLLTFARHLDMKLSVDVYEPRDFSRSGPVGCNMCGGIVSESLMQALALEGISLPSTVVQRGIDSYVLHTDDDRIRLETPLRERRIAAVHRGGGPRGAGESKWGGLDSHLLALAQSLGARVVRARVGDVGWDGERPQVRLRDEVSSYDLLVGATGVNSSAWSLYESLGVKCCPPRTTQAYITEVFLGDEVITRHFGNSMHVFLLNVPRLDMAAAIPKGDYVTVVLLGKEIDRRLVNAFFESDAVKRCFPGQARPAQGICHCSPKINVGEVSLPFLDRVVLVGDSAATRLYKDGVGAAYRTAKAAAWTAVFRGVSARDFRKHYLPVYRSIAHDNRFGSLMFFVVQCIKRMRPVLRGVMRMTEREQRIAGAARRMSLVMWDLFTGSAPYRDVFLRTLDPRFNARLLWESGRALRSGSRGKEGAEAPETRHTGTEVL